jgi:hypothetical protein
VDRLSRVPCSKRRRGFGGLEQGRPFLSCGATAYGGDKHTYTAPLKKGRCQRAYPPLLFLHPIPYYQYHDDDPRSSLEPARYGYFPVSFTRRSQFRPAYSLEEGLFTQRRLTRPINNCAFGIRLPARPNAPHHVVICSMGCVEARAAEDQWIHSRYGGFPTVSTVESMEHSVLSGRSSSAP